MKVSIAFLFLFFSACTTLSVHEQTKNFPNHTWSSKDTVVSSFEITDTNSLYNMYFVLRHEDAYRYKNIWVNIQLTAPDTTYTIKRDFILADNEHWLGATMSDVVEHRLAFSKAPTKLKKGKYKFVIQQIMREDPLNYVLQAGIRVQKNN